MMKQKRSKRPPGQIRQSQVVTTFGPGAMLDLPNHSVLVAGLDHWSTGGDEIQEPRLIENLKKLLDVTALRLYSPPPDQEDPTAPPTGITGWQFPEWFITQDVESTDPASTVRSRMLVHRLALTRGKFIDQNKKKRPVVPVRFVRACRCGHIGDIDWRRFVHNGPSECRRQLWIDERGTSGDLAEVWVRCECKADRNLGEAALMQTQALANCDGSRPWLGPYTKEACGEPNRLLIRTASNAYFTQQMGVIALPDRDETIKQAVDAAWEFVEAVEDIDQLKYERKKAKVKAALDGLSDEEVFAEIQARRGFALEQPKSVKQAELETLVASKKELDNDRPDGNFFARAVPKATWSKPWMLPIERVVLVHRLREVVAQVGFTRFEAAAPDIEGELEIGVRRATLARRRADKMSLEAVYSRVYEKARPTLEKALKEKEAELDGQLDAYRDLPPRLKERAVQRMKALQDEIDDLRGDLKNLRVPWDQVRADLAARREALERTTAILNQEGHFRQKTEALKCVVDKIVCHFKGTRLDSVEMVPAEDAAVRPLTFPGPLLEDSCLRGLAPLRETSLLTGLPF